ncbi:NYN domain-containing protein [Patescibacteria group bacterium]|nr:NYN domain-containing protein [Patescibacteria group bacterium]
MTRHPEQRVGIFVDVQNMYHSAKNLYNCRVNFKNILEEAVAERKLVLAIAYVIKSQSKEELSFFDALDKQGFKVKMKGLQIFPGGAKKADWDVGIAMDAIKHSSKTDVTVIVSGDGDFVPLIEYLQMLGQEVEVMAFGESTSHLIIERADDFTDLSKNKRKFLLKTK